MVRLKDQSFNVEYITKIYFNSTMVRLKVNLFIILAFKFLKFQFHYGTIKRHTAALRDSVKMYFNSTMVRLKVALITDYGRKKAISIPLWYD